MASFTVTVKDCATSAALTGATLGNGKCYSASNGVYTFSNCDSLAACAGNSGCTVSVSPTSLPASGGTATFSVYYYGRPASFSATKSKTGTGGSTWGGTATISSAICPTTQTVSLSATSNTGTSSITYTLTALGSSKSVTQSGQTISRTITFNFSGTFNLSCGELTSYFDTLGNEFILGIDLNGGVGSVQYQGTVSSNGQHVVTNVSTDGITYTTTKTGSHTVTFTFIRSNMDLNSCLRLETVDGDWPMIENSESEDKSTEWTATYTVPSGTTDTTINFIGHNTTYRFEKCK